MTRAFFPSIFQPSTRGACPSSQFQIRFHISSSIPGRKAHSGLTDYLQLNCSIFQLRIGTFHHPLLTTTRSWNVRLLAALSTSHASAHSAQKVALLRPVCLTFSVPLHCRESFDHSLISVFPLLDLQMKECVQQGRLTQKLMSTSV